MDLFLVLVGNIFHHSHNHQVFLWQNLGFATRKLGDYENGEKYYLQGLEIDPNHKGINEYLGELYVATNRMDLAKERLKVLENCNCEEYQELKEVIEGTKKSKY